MKSLLFALQFLTIFCLKKDLSPKSSEIIWSQALFPLVGGLLGVIVAGGAWLLSHFIPPDPLAAIILVVLFVLTRGFHLDGLADSADGLMANVDRSRSLEIMKDSRTGAMGVAAVVLTILAKFAALKVIVDAEAFKPLISAPVVARIAPAVLAAILPYARNQGLAETMVRKTGPAVALSDLVLGLGLLALLLSVKEIFLIMIASFLLWLTLGGYFWFRLRGITGDLLGATVEITETLVWIIFSCILTR
ncbi:adenosylcobinamide-GDP ribazoletransferase [Thermosulfuriphilus sp.]